MIDTSRSDETDSPCLWPLPRPGQLTSWNALETSPDLPPTHGRVAGLGRRRQVKRATSPHQYPEIDREDVKNLIRSYRGMIPPDSRGDR